MRCKLCSSSFFPHFSHAMHFIWHHQPVLTPASQNACCYKMLQNVTKCYKMLQCHIARIICSHIQTVFDGYYEAVYVTLGLTPTPPLWNVLRYPFGANLPYIAVVYIGNPGLWSVWKSFLWWRAIEHLLSCKMQKTLLRCQRCISPVEGLPAENAKWMDKDCQVPQIKTFPLLLYFPSCAIPIIFNHISRVNRSTVRQWLSK